MGSISPADPNPWWKKPFGMLQTNLREIDVDMDVEHVADYIVNHGASAWLIGIGGIQAQYPSELPFHSKNPGLAKRKSGDLISDAMAAAKARNLRLLARMDFSKVSAEVANDHPEWLYKSPEGRRQEHTGGLVSVCPAGKYYQERIFDILEEVTRRYPVDGFFINWVSMNEEDYYKHYHGVCQCDSCKAAWSKLHGNLPLPTKPSDPTYSQWLVFARDLIDELTGRVRAFIGQRLPSAGLILGKTADIMFHEANNADGREMWHHATSETVSTWSSYRPEVPVLVNSTTFMDMPYRMASEEPAMFAQYLIQAISRGGNPSTYMMGVPGRIPYLCMDVGAEITGFHKKNLSLYDGMRPSAKTALVKPDRPQMTATQYDQALAEYRGFYSGMQELHVPFDVISGEHLADTATNGGLSRYSVIILPNLGKLALPDITALDAWVHAGGNLVASGSSGVDEKGNVQLQSLPAVRELAKDNKRELLWSSYFAPPHNAEDVAKHVYTGPLVPLYGVHHMFEWKTGTSGGYKLLARAAFSPPEKAYGNIEVEQRGYGSGAFGKGKGIVIPMTVGRAYRELGLGVYRDFFVEILEKEGQAKEPFSLKIAEQVEMTLNRNGSKTILHLINMSGARKQNFGSHIPITGGSIKLEASNVTATAMVSGQQLEVKDGEIALPTLDRFEVIVLEGI